MNAQTMTLIKQYAAKIARSARATTFESNSIPQVENDLTEFLTKAIEADKTNDAKPQS